MMTLRQVEFAHVNTIQGVHDVDEASRAHKAYRMRMCDFGESYECELTLGIRDRDDRHEVWLRGDADQLAGLRDAIQRLLDMQEEHHRPEPVHDGPILP